MSLDLLFYEPADGPATPDDALAAALEAEVGIELDPEQDGGYRPWHWRDPRTGARCEGDLGRLPLEDDPIHPDKAYEGWRRVPLVIHLPLAVAHWHCVEAGNLCQRLLDRLDEVAVLNTEDEGGEDAEPGPGPLDRVRLLTTWEQLHVAQTAGREDCWRMDRRASLALWRYRREQAGGREAHPELCWPGALALLHEGAAHSATFWMDPTQDLALPPVELVVVRHADGSAGVMPADRLRAAAGGGTTLDYAAATTIPSSPAVVELFTVGDLDPVEAYRALDDLEWSD